MPTLVAPYVPLMDILRNVGAQVTIGDQLEANWTNYTQKEIKYFKIDFLDIDIEYIHQISINVVEDRVISANL